MRYIGIIILLVLCLTLLLLTGCMINTVTPGIGNGNFGNQPSNNPSSNNPNSNNYQNTSTDPVEEPATEEPGTVYPQQWATGDGTVENPWANNCIQKAYDFVPAGGTIFLKAGYYTLSANIEINKKVNIVSEGRNRTMIKTSSLNGIVVRHDNCTLRGFTIDGDAQTDGTKYLSPIDVSNCDYAILEDIEVKNAGYYGVNIYQVNHSLFQDIYSHDNYRHGIHPGSNVAGRNKWNIYRDIYAWDNGHTGFKDGGNDADPNEECFNVFDNLQCWDNTYDGIMITTQKNSVLSNLSATGNGRRGIYLYDVDDFNVHDCSITLSGKEGLYIKNSDNINFTNVIVKNNNVSDTDNIGGVIIEDSSGIKFTSCQSYDDRGTLLQLYGIELYGTNTGISLLNCKLTPNATEEIYNPAGAVLTVITEKREFLLLSL